MSVLKNDKLDAMIMMSSHVLAEKSADALLSVDTTKTEIPKSFAKKVNRMIKREHRKQEYRELYSFGKHVAAVFLIVCTVSFALVMSVEAVRVALWHTLVEWYEDYIAISYVTDESTPEFIEDKKEPTSIPDSWEREVIIDSQSMYYIQFTFDDESVITFKQKVFDDNEDWIDGENSIVENVKIGDYDGDLIKLIDKMSYYLIWSDGSYSYTISCDNDKLSNEMLIEIAESVR